MWEDFSGTVGFWADMEHPYVTYDNNFIESEWWALKQIWDKGLLYKGFKIVPYNTFKVPKVGIAAGVRVEEGEIAATDSVRLVRDGIVVFNGKIASMRHYKDEAKSLKSGSEGGIGLENFQDIKPGDQIEGYRIDQVARTE